MMKPWLCHAAGVLMAMGTPFLWAEADTHVIQRGWQPPTALVGDENGAAAAKSLRQWSDLQSVVLSNTRIDAETDQFVNDLWSTFERFDLRSFHRMLPDTAGQDRSFSVYAHLNDGRYYVQRDMPAFLSGGPVPTAYGELAVNVRSREIQGEKTHFLLRGDVQAGLGPIRWQTLAAASRRTLDLLTDGESANVRGGWQSSDMWMRRVRSMNPRLGGEDVAVIAPLWAAFPSMWDLLARIGRLDNVVMETPAGEAVRHLKMVFVIDPARMARDYPALADHLEALGAVTHMDVVAESPEGEIMYVGIDSETLTLSISAYVQDGHLVPRSENGQWGAPLVDFFERPGRLRVRGSGYTRILGVQTTLEDLRVDVQIEPADRRARVHTAMTHVPRVEVSGNALGFMPTGVIDAFLPVNIDELMLEFMTVACEGNDGRGIVADVEIRDGGSGGNTLHASAAMEALDNVFVRFGMGIVNDRFLPDADVSLEARELLLDVQAAFSRDLQTYERVIQL